MSSAPVPSFHLLETMRLENGTVIRLDRHLRRLAGSALVFSRQFDAARVHEAIDAAAADHPDGLWRMRLTVASDGIPELTVTPHEDAPGALWLGSDQGLVRFDPKTEQWSIWWLDGRDPSGDIDPPVKGRFENGVGAFFGDITLNGKPMRMRFIWSHITPTSARWEQAYSADAGKTWETNWTMNFQRR